MLGLILSRNGILAIAILALFGWGQIALKKHDQKVEQRVVANIEAKSNATVQKARVAQRRVDPAKSPGVLEQRYCADCYGPSVRGVGADQRPSK